MYLLVFGASICRLRKSLLLIRRPRRRAPLGAYAVSTLSYVALPDMHAHVHPFVIDL